MEEVKEYFTQEEIVEDIIDLLEDGYNGYYCDLMNEVANIEPYIYYDSEAEEALQEYGVFKAINEIKEYEEEHFGKMMTSIEPCALASMLYYVKVDEFMYDTFDTNEVLAEIGEKLNVKDLWNEKATTQVNNNLIAELKEYLKN